MQYDISRLSPKHAHNLSAVRPAVDLISLPGGRRDPPETCGPRLSY